jgi:hypothetical protein
VSYHRVCDKCELPIPNIEKIDPFTVPCSIYHIRCLRCGWPVAKSIMDEDEICRICRRGNKR